jgi:hypothetical protein
MTGENPLADGGERARCLRPWYGPPIKATAHAGTVDPNTAKRQRSPPSRVWYRPQTWSGQSDTSTMQAAGIG